MSEINDMQVYTNRMRMTALDKCWWLSLLHDDITTIVDLGCGDGEIFKVIDTLFPGKYHYFGIDNCEEMRRLATNNLAGRSATICGDLSELGVYNIDGEQTVFVMNSVMHELYSYLSVRELDLIFEKINKLSPKYIAIRDMHRPPVDKVRIEEMEDAIARSPYMNQFYNFVEHRTEQCQLDTYLDNFPFEFLLKYFYTENWERERDEQYLWAWGLYITGRFPDYIIEQESDFTIPYLVDKVKKDFNDARVSFYAPTHKKVLLRRKDK